MNLPKEEDLEIIHYTSVKDGACWIIQTLTAIDKQGGYYTFFHTGELYCQDGPDEIAASRTLTEEECDYVKNLRIQLTITLNAELRKLALSMSIF